LQIDNLQKQFSYIRAGHCPLLYYSAAKNSCEYFEDKGIGLGIIRDNVFSAMMHEYKMDFGSNDVLVLFTDGLIEAVDESSQNSFTMDALCNTLRNYKECTAQDICNGILNDFRSVIHSQKSPDDLALIVIKFV
jgi:serine phosphatase RsbU (regulator of sigma subunit)